MNTPRIICLITHSRSGSNLFHSLLDHHPQIMCFPRYMQFDGFWSSVRSRKNDHSHLSERFVEKYPYFFSGRCWSKHDRADQLGLNRDETFTVDTALFKKFAQEELAGREVTRSSLFIALHAAYHRACGREIPGDPVILYHIHYIDCSGELSAFFEDFSGKIKALVMTRHPVDNLIACVEVMKWRDFIFSGELFSRHKQILRGITHIRRACPGLDVRYLPFEHLLERHREVMEIFVKWSELAWSDTLMASTIHGKPWWGNGKFPHNGIYGHHEAYRPSTFLEKKDTALFMALIPRRMEMLGYGPFIGRRDAADKRILSILILPTRAEWEAMKAILSIRYWVELAQVSKNYHQMLSCACRMNPFTWAYYFLKRVLWYHRFATAGLGGSIDEPVLTDGLLEEKAV